MVCTNMSIDATRLLAVIRARRPLASVRPKAAVNPIVPLQIETDGKCFTATWKITCIPVARSAMTLIEVAGLARLPIRRKSLLMQFGRAIDIIWLNFGFIQVVSFSFAWPIRMVRQFVAFGSVVILIRVELYWR